MAPSTAESVRLVTTLRYSVYATRDGGETDVEGHHLCSKMNSTTNMRRDYQSAPTRTRVCSATRNDAAGPAPLHTSKSHHGVEIPRMRLRELNAKNAPRFVELMEKHGFVVLADIGIIRRTYLECMRLLKGFFEEPSESKEACKGTVHFNERGIPMWHAGYERCGKVREAFRLAATSTLASPSESPHLQLVWPCERLRFSWVSLLRLLQLLCHRALTLTLGRPVHGALPPAIKSKPANGTRTRDTRVNGSSLDKGVGMGRRGPGSGQDESARGPGGSVIGPSDRCSICGGCRRRQARAGVGRGLGGESDRCESSGTGASVGGGGMVTAEISKGEVTGSSRNTYAGDEEEECRYYHSDDGHSGDGNGCRGGANSNGDCEGFDDSRDGGDFSVSYALHYPNEFADPALEEEDLTVGEHVDPSLFVAEPCCGVEGLEIRDRASGRWLAVESLCASLGLNGSRSLVQAEGREIVLFGGKALERATEGRVKGAPHRVRRGDHGRRYCFIYEQKYAEFFPPPALD